MTTDTLANGLKAVFGSTNNIQPSSLIPYADSSRNPAGFTDMSKLASVLGEATTLIIGGSDLNSYTEYGTYYFESGDTPLNCPTLYSFRMYVLKINSIRKVQIIIDAQNKKWCRRCVSGSFSTYKWERVYDESILTESAVLSPLASALGVQDTIRNGDLNNLTVSGTWRTVSCTNAPTAYGFTKVIAVSGDIRQEFYNIYDENVTPKGTPNTYMRNYVNDAWTAWVKIATV